MIIDDTAVMRRIVAELPGRGEAVRVIGHATDPIGALAMMEQAWPDVILLDLAMPRLDGVAFLRKIMKVRPTPVIVCSSHACQGAEHTLQALAAGAIATFIKPDGEARLKEAVSELIAKLRAASGVRMALAVE
jgi:two-component system chemotaxis response regulator CheB